MGDKDFDFVVFEAGGKQHFARQGDRILLDAEGMEKIDKVLLIKKGDDIRMGNPFLENASAELEFIERKKGKKLISFKKKRRKGYRRKIGHRQNYFIYALKSVAF
ncbi:MAG: 50S ribosomal protein L21 [Elusimicrobia bacterium]|nr:50S ribosomal protein L21 [Elusimicrobiota bacterium]